MELFQPYCKATRAVKTQTVTWTPAVKRRTVPAKAKHFNLSNKKTARNPKLKKKNLDEFRKCIEIAKKVMRKRKTQQQILDIFKSPNRKQPRVGFLKKKTYTYKPKLKVQFHGVFRDQNLENFKMFIEEPDKAKKNKNKNIKAPRTFRQVTNSSLRLPRHRSYGSFTYLSRNKRRLAVSSEESTAI